MTPFRVRGNECPLLRYDETRNDREIVKADFRSFETDDPVLHILHIAAYVFCDHSITLAAVVGKSLLLMVVDPGSRT